MDVSGSTLLITGATSENGLGMAMAQRFRRQGCTVVVSGRRQERLDEIAERHPGLDTVLLDVDDPASFEQAAASLRRSHPDLDAVMTMAGLMLPEDVRDPASAAVGESIITSNLLGTIRTVRTFLPRLLERPRAAILTVSSGLGFVPRADVPSYCASKAGVHFYTDALRMQLADTNVQVVHIVPPAVRTSLMHQEGMEHAMPVDRFADEVMALLRDHPDGEEVLVDAVRFLRFAEANGEYRDAMRMVSPDVHQNEKRST